MPYVTLAQIKAALPDSITAQLLDDNNVGSADALSWSAIAEAVQREIDGKLGQRYPVPFDPVPAIVVDAAFVLAAELCYQRRGYYGDQNPWAGRAQSIRGTLGQPGGQAGQLDRIATGAEPLTPTAKKVNAPAIAITETAKTTPAAGNMLC